MLHCAVATGASRSGCSRLLRQLVGVSFTKVRGGNLNFNLYTRVKGLSGTNTVTLEMGDAYNTSTAASYIANGLTVNFSNEGSSNRLTTDNDYYDDAKEYTVANWNSTDKTFTITANVNVTFAIATITFFLFLLAVYLYYIYILTYNY